MVKFLLFGCNIKGDIAFQKLQNVWVVFILHGKFEFLNLHGTKSI